MTILYWLGEHTDEFGISIGMTTSIHGEVLDSVPSPACPLRDCPLKDHRLRPVTAAEYAAVMNDDAQGSSGGGVQPELHAGHGSMTAAIKLPGGES